MSDLDLSALSLDELETLQKNVAKAIEEFHVKRRKDALAAVEATAREAGFTLAELMGKPEKTGKKVSPPRFAHPENPELTWTGRGRQPAWFKELVAGGTPVEELEI